MDNAKIPVLQSKPNSNRPVLRPIKEDQSWSFSFKYFKQIDFFGLENVNSKWYVSLLEKLADFSKIDSESFFKDHKLKNDSRYHKIDWNARNIPIKKTDIHWVDKEIIDNDDEFPFLQFQISKSLGRVVGFWLNKIFYIVLLDPLHNIQPAGGKYHYRVNESNVTFCKYTYLINKIDEIKGKECSCENCSTHEELHKIQEDFHCENFIYFQLDDDFYKEFRSQTIKYSVRNIMETGLLNLIETD